MKCREVHKSLVIYLDDEVNHSKKLQIKAHLEMCETCMNELSSLSITKERVSLFLHGKADRAVLSSRLWESIQARLNQKPNPLKLWFQKLHHRTSSVFGHLNPIVNGGLKMKRIYVLAAILSIILVACGIAFVPSARDQVGAVLKSIGSWFKIKSPGGGDYEIAFSGSTDFTILHPTYMTSGLQESSGMSMKETSDGSASFRLSYHNKEEFVSITQKKKPDNASLPSGKEVIVDNKSAIMVTGLRGNFEFGHKIPENAITETFGTFQYQSYPSRDGAIEYINGKLLTWFTDDSKVELLSNLSEEEIILIAESLIPAEPGQGEPPFQTPDIHSEGDEETTTIEYDERGVIKYIIKQSGPLPNGIVEEFHPSE